MIGLIKNNYYASLANLKWALAAMLVLGIVALSINAKGNNGILIGYLLLCMTVFPANALASMRMESASKWSKYKLTAPVTRSAIVASYYIHHLVWLLAGVILAGVCALLSLSLYGFPFDRPIDILNLFVAGIAISLLMGAIFYPLYYLGGQERSESIFAISLICASGIFAGLVMLINWSFGFKMTTEQIVLSAAILFTVALVAFAVSYPIAIGIFKRKEY